jgi:hypothetical protein
MLAAPNRSVQRCSMTPVSGSHTCCARRPLAVARMTQPERGGLGRVSDGSGAIVMYPQRCIPARFVPVRARLASSPTVIPSGVTNRMQVDHIAIDTSHGTLPGPCVLPWSVVRCGICRSNSLSNSMMNATSTCERSADNGSRPAPPSVSVMTCASSRGSWLMAGPGACLARSPRPTFSPRSDSRGRQQALSANLARLQ